jgi:hypothetical protein
VKHLPYAKWHLGSAVSGAVCTTRRTKTMVRKTIGRDAFRDKPSATRCAFCERIFLDGEPKESK